MEDRRCATTQAGAATRGTRRRLREHQCDHRVDAGFRRLFVISEAPLEVPYETNAAGKAGMLLAPIGFNAKWRHVHEHKLCRATRESHGSCSRPRSDFS